MEYGEIYRNSAVEIALLEPLRYFPIGPFWPMQYFSWLPSPLLRPLRLVFSLIADRTVITVAAFRNIAIMAVAVLSMGSFCTFHCLSFVTAVTTVAVFSGFAVRVVLSFPSMLPVAGRKLHCESLFYCMLCILLYFVFLSVFVVH